MLGRWAAWLPHLGKGVISHTLHVPVMGLGWGVLLGGQTEAMGQCRLWLGKLRTKRFSRQLGWVWLPTCHPIMASILAGAPGIA